MKSSKKLKLESTLIVAIVLTLSIINIAHANSTTEVSYNNNKIYLATNDDYANYDDDEDDYKSSGSSSGWNTGSYSESDSDYEYDSDKSSNGSSSGWETGSYEEGTQDNEDDSVRDKSPSKPSKNNSYNKYDNDYDSDNTYYSPSSNGYTRERTKWTWLKDLIDLTIIIVVLSYASWRKIKTYRNKRR